MNVRIFPGAIHWTLESILRAVTPFTEAVSKELSKDYGGPMEHLWIELELSSPLTNDRKPWSFRFQQSVSPPRELKVFNIPKRKNVGHYSVGPAFKALESMPIEDVPRYLIQLIYASTEVLLKKRQLKGFDAQRFRADFAAAAENLGCRLEVSHDE